MAGVSIGGLALLGAGLALHAAIAAYGARDRLASTHALAEALDLTDIALFTEARYTRHLSLADQHSPFQDAPMVIEHFPAGSLTPPRTPMQGRLGTESEER